jgi:TolA-binding protein
MMKFFYSFALTCLLFIFSGCSYDPSYEAEKAYWEARKIDRELHQDNPDGLEEEDYDQIIAALEKAANLAPMDVLAAQAQFQIAQIYLGLEKREQARETLESVFSKFSESENKNEQSSKDIAAQALFWIGRIHEGSGEMEQAEETYAMLMDRYPLTKRGLDAPIHMIRYYKNRGNISKTKEASAKARSHYQALIDKYAGTSIEQTVRRYSLQVYALEEAWQDVLNFWETEIDTKLERSETIRAKIAKADLLASRMENIPEAEKIYKDLLDQYPVEPITPLIKVRLGYLLIAASKTEEAREIFAKIPNDYPENEELIVQSLFGLVSADYKDGDLDKALERIDDIYAEYPDSASTLRIPLMKYVYYQRTGKSNDQVEKALETALKDYTARWNSGDSTRADQAVGRLLLLCLVQKKDWDAAASHLKSLSMRFPNDPGFTKLMKTLYWQNSGDPAKALQILFDSSNDSPFFQPEDSPMQDIEETLDDTLKSK